MLFWKYYNAKKKQKQIPDVSYTNKYQIHALCSYGYKLLGADDQFSKSCKSYIDKDAIHKFIISICLKKVTIVAMWWKNILIMNLWWLKKTINILRALLNAGFVVVMMMVMFE